MARRPPPPEAAAATQFKPGQSGNPSGRPKGIKPFSVLQLISEALTEAGTTEQAKLAFQACVMWPTTTLQALELAARLNGEVKKVGDEGSQTIAVVILEGGTYRPGMFAATPAALRAARATAKKDAGT